MRNLLQALYSSDYTWSEKWALTKAWPVIYSHDSAPTPLSISLLHIGAKARDIQLLAKILNTEENIDINEKDTNGWTALHIASCFFDRDLVPIKFLVEQKEADINAITNSGDTAMSLAIRDLNDQLVAYFLENGKKLSPDIDIPVGFVGGSTTVTFCDGLYKYFEEKSKQNPNEEKFKEIFKEVDTLSKVCHAKFEEFKNAFNVKDETKLEVVIQDEQQDFKENLPKEIPGNILKISGDDSHSIEE